MGDSSGVGPEILLKAFAGKEITWPAVAFGDISILEYCNSLLDYGVRLHRVERVGDIQEDYLNVLDFGLMGKDDLTPGKINEKSGAAAREYVIAATKAALAGDIAAVVTLPMNKAATKLTDISFSGHTELIATLCGAKSITMMLASDQLIVTHISGHIPLSDAVKRVKQERILDVIKTTHEAVARFVEKPRIAVAGLNPHSGEGGAFGREDIDEIEPAVTAAKAQGIDATGPIPPDTVFHMAANKRLFDAVVCMYHDQGHIPLKLVDFEGGVNITLGLPIIRTSVDHGTAFDIAYQGKASTRSFVKALEYAVKLAG